MVELSVLNDKQREAVEYVDGPILVIAGAGSGKTRVLTYRIAHLIDSGIVTPYEFVAITFTNKAAKEMLERVRTLVGDVADQMRISTFHSLCVRILRQNADRLGYKQRFTIYDSGDSKRLIERVSKELNIDPKRFPPRSIQSAISMAKSSLERPENLLKSGDFRLRQIGEVFKLYENRTKENNAMDFDDLITNTVYLFEQDSDVLSSYQDRFKHILIDEFQDTNHAQNMLVKLLGDKYRNVFAVGDNDQSIYGFRGANMSNILEFERSFPEVKSVFLEQNYRSTQTILDAANSVIECNVSRKKKALWSQQGVGEKIVILRAGNEKDEARYISRDIEKMRVKGIKYNQIAIMYRTNGQSRALEEALISFGIPYKVIGGTKYFDRKEVKDIMAYMNCVVNPDDRSSIERVINVPKRGVGDSSVGKLNTFSLEKGISFIDALRNAHSSGIPKKAVNAVASFVELLDELSELYQSDFPTKDIISHLLDKTGYLEELKGQNTVEADGRVENINEILNLASEFPDLDSFLEHAALVNDTDDLTSDVSVSLMTLHSAKGLEFDTVYLVGLEERIFPHSRSMEDPKDIEEERRLFYVGITRAKKFLTISFAFSRAQFGSVLDSLPSRFLKEIPEEFVRFEECYYSIESSGGKFNDSRRSSSFKSRSSGGFNPRQSQHDDYGDDDDYYSGGDYRDYHGDHEYRTFGSGTDFSRQSTMPRNIVDFSSKQRSRSSTGALSNTTGDLSDKTPDISGKVVPISLFDKIDAKMGDEVQSTKSQEAEDTNRVGNDLNLQIGDKIEHSRWGVGVVISVGGKDPEKTAEIRFDSGGTRKLMLSIAPITKI